MWIILLFLWVSVILRNNAQELSSLQTQSDVETTYTHSGLNSDSTRSPITLSIRNGRNGNDDRSTAQNSEISEYYSRDWENLRIVLPEFNSNRDSDKHEIVNGQSVIPDPPIFFKRSYPRDNSNFTSQIERRNEFSSIPMPLIYFQNAANLTSDTIIRSSDQVYEEIQPNEGTYRNPENFQPFDLYGNIQPRTVFYNPSQSSLNSNIENFKSDVEEKQVSSSGDERITESIPSTSTTVRNSETFDLYRTQNVLPPFYIRSLYNLNSNAGNSKSDLEPKQISSSAIPKPINFDEITSRTNEDFPKPLPTEAIEFYRNQGYFPPMVPAYFPAYPFNTYQQGGSYHPMIPYLPNGQVFNREAGSEVGEPILKVPERQTLSQNVPERLDENLPSETVANTIPGNQFRPYLTPFLPPVLPHNLPFGYSLGPISYPQARNVPKEGIIPNVLPPPPVPIRPVPDIVPAVPPQIDSLPPEAETSVILPPEVNPEEVVPVEELNPPKTPYAFGFDMNDGKGNNQHRQEVSDAAGVVTGSYGFNTLDGKVRFVVYKADGHGFRAFIQTNEPGVASLGSADVVIEKLPEKSIVEGVREAEILAIPDIESGLNVPGTIPEAQ